MASDFATTPTTTATYDDVSYSAWITDDVYEALMAAVVTPQLLDVRDISGVASKALQFPKANKFTAASVSEGVELANTALTTNRVTLTAAEVGIQATITDVLEVSSIPATHGAQLKQLGRAVADKIDVDICALFSGFSNSIGSTGVDLDVADLLGAIYQIEAADAGNYGGLVAVLHPVQTADIRTDVVAQQASIFTTGSGLADGATNAMLGKARNGYFGEWFGIDIYQSTNVPTANGGDDRAGGIFVENYALGMVKKWDVRVEAMRWPPIRGVVLTVTAMYGVGEIEDAAGVAVVSDA